MRFIDDVALMAGVSREVTKRRLMWLLVEQVVAVSLVAWWVIPH